MTTGGLRQLILMDRSRLGDESLEDGLDDRDKDDLGLDGGPAESSGVMMSESPEIEADFGTFPVGDLGFSGVSSWCAIRREAPLRKVGLVPVLLLRSRMRRRLETTSSSSSAEMAKRGMMSRLWVLFITSGLALRSDCEELEEARGRSPPLCPSVLLSPLAKCLCPSPGEGNPLPSHRSPFSSLWLRSDDDKL